MPSASATPIPGSATCEIASDASAMRRITAKQPIIPAAIAIAIEAAMAPASCMDVVVDRAADLAQPLRGEDLGRCTEPRALAAQAQHRGGVVVHHAQLVRDHERGEPALAAQAGDQLVESLLAGLVDPRGRLRAPKHRRGAD